MPGDPSSLPARGTLDEYVKSEPAGGRRVPLPGPPVVEFQLSISRPDRLEIQMPQAGASRGSIRRLHRLLPLTDRRRKLAFQAWWNPPLIARRPVLGQGDLQYLTCAEHNPAAIKGLVNPSRLPELRVHTRHHNGAEDDEACQFHNSMVLLPVALDLPRPVAPGASRR